MSVRQAITEALYAIYCELGLLGAPAWVLDIAYGAVDYVAEG